MAHWVFEEEAGQSLMCQLDIQVERFSRQLDKNFLHWDDGAWLAWQSHI